MILTLRYRGDTQGFHFPPVNLLMIANEFRKHGIPVELVRDCNNYDYNGEPSDNIFNDSYRDLLSLLRTVKGSDIEFNKLEADITEIDFDIPAVLTSLGCVYKCKYCPHHDINFFKRDMDIVLNELEKACEYSYFEFLDNNIMGDKERFFSIIEHIPEGVIWGGLMNISTYSDDDLKHLYDKGLRNVYLGLESFNKCDLDYFGKVYHHRVDSKEFLLKLKSIGFNVLTFIVRGLPNETKDSWNNMINWLNDNGIYYTIAQFHNNGELIPHPIYSPDEYSNIIVMDEHISNANFVNFIQNTLKNL